MYSRLQAKGIMNDMAAGISLLPCPQTIKTDRFTIKGLWNKKVRDISYAPPNEEFPSGAYDRRTGRLKSQELLPYQPSVHAPRIQE